MRFLSFLLFYLTIALPATAENTFPAGSFNVFCTTSYVHMMEGTSSEKTKDNFCPIFLSGFAAGMLAEEMLVRRKEISSNKVSSKDMCTFEDLNGKALLKAYLDFTTTPEGQSLLAGNYKISVARFFAKRYGACVTNN
ncbi:MAG: hypothetical protein PW788_09140 [Micavibrio sp.]|nr:hypothetical protein [Micavibrio sp.]